MFVERRWMALALLAPVVAEARKSKVDDLPSAAGRRGGWAKAVQQRQ
jgi:hypothetical protein